MKIIHITNSSQEVSLSQSSAGLYPSSVSWLKLREPGDCPQSSASAPSCSSLGWMAALNESIHQTAKIWATFLGLCSSAPPKHALHIVPCTYLGLIILLLRVGWLSIRVRRNGWRGCENRWFNFVQSDLCCIVNVETTKLGWFVLHLLLPIFLLNWAEIPSYSIFMKAKVLRGPTCLAHFKEKCTLLDLLACLVTSTLYIFFYEQTFSRSGP